MLLTLIVVNIIAVFFRKNREEMIWSIVATLCVCTIITYSIGWFLPRNSTVISSLHPIENTLVYRTEEQGDFIFKLNVINSESKAEEVKIAKSNLDISLKKESHGFAVNRLTFAQDWYWLIAWKFPETRYSMIVDPDNKDNVKFYIECK